MCSCRACSLRLVAAAGVWGQEALPQPQPSKHTGCITSRVGAAGRRRRAVPQQMAMHLCRSAATRLQVDFQHDASDRRIQSPLWSRRIYLPRRQCRQEDSFHLLEAITSKPGLFSSPAARCEALMLPRDQYTVCFGAPPAAPTHQRDAQLCLQTVICTFLVTLALELSGLRRSRVPSGGLGRGLHNALASRQGSTAVAASTSDGSSPPPPADPLTVHSAYSHLIR